MEAEKTNQLKNEAISQPKLSIPVIDIGGLRNGTLQQKIKIGKQIDEANRKIGFFLIKNTGITTDFIQKTLEVADQFFMSPMDNKMKCRIDDVPEQKPWGYFPLHMQLLQRGQDYNKKQKSVYLNDVNESYNIQNDNPNAKMPARIFPQEPVSFGDVMSQYYKAIHSVGNLLLEGFAYGLDLPVNFFEDKFDRCGSVLRLLHYPDYIKLEPGQFRASEHTDYGGLTLLYSTATGLQVKTTQGEWIDIEVPKDHFVINIGDLTSFWTNNRWVSTPHRVIAKDIENPVKRYSLVFFHTPNYDAKVDCIPTCQSKENPAKYGQVLAGDFIMMRFKASIGEKAE